MSTDTALWQAIMNMPDALKTELLHYAEYLVDKYPKIKILNQHSEQQHGYGSWAGQISMSDDFDEP